MKTSITLKLALAFIGVSLLTGLALTFFFRSLISENFERLVLDQQAEAKLILVEAYYAQNESWEGVEQVLSPAIGVVGGMDPDAGKGRATLKPNPVYRLGNALSV